MTIRLFRSYLLALAAVAGLAPAAAAQDQAPYERILVPIGYESELPGAFGSLWSTILTGINDTDVFVEVSAGRPTGNCIAVGTGCKEAPHQVFNLRLIAGSNPNTGAFVYVGKPGAGRVRFTLRVQDVSRQAQTWGTTIPVVRERDAFAGLLHLLDIPIDPRFRVALRIYDFDASPESPAADRSVRLRIYHRDFASPFLETVLPFGVHDIRGGDFPQVPSTVMIGNLTDAFPDLLSLPSIAPFGRNARIEIEPASPGLRFWAFVSVTNNETQHVTVIAPAQ